MIWHAFKMSNLQQFPLWQKVQVILERMLQACLWGDVNWYAADTSNFRAELVYENALA